MKTKIIALLLCAGIVVSCNNTQKGAGIGAGGGAVLGGIIGAIVGDKNSAAIGAAIGGAVGAGAGAVIGNRMDKAKKKAEQAMQTTDANGRVTTAGKVEMVTDTNGLEAVKVTFDSGLLFQTGKSDLSAAAKTSLGKFATVLKENSDCDVVIQGYTDNQGFKGATAEESVQKNQALSLDRATAVSSYLMGLTVPASQIKKVEGLGQTNPVADNSTAAGQAQNRRVEVYMYASEKMIQEAETQSK